MSIDLNGNQLSSMVFGSIGDPILATGDSYSSEINLNSSEANITLTYNNNGNPASSAYLDYISMQTKKKNCERCEKCEKAFGRNDELKAHISAVHLAVKSHNCKYCKKSIALLFSL